MAKEIEDQEEIEWLGFDPDASTPNDTTIEQVDLEDIPSPFSNEELLQLREIDVLQDSNNYGIDIYLNALHLVGVL